MSVKVTWYSHACVLIETEGTNLLVDPFISGNPLAPVKPDEIPADYILVSHGHGDHVGDTVDIAKRTGARGLPLINGSISKLVPSVSIKTQAWLYHVTLTLI